MISLIAAFLFSQAPIDFADYLYETGDYERAALEYERIGFTAISEDTSLAGYALLRAGQALLDADNPQGAANVYAFGARNLPSEKLFTYGMLRSNYGMENYGEVGKLASKLEETELEREADLYRSFAFVFTGDTAKAIGHLTTITGNGLIDSTLSLIRTPLRHRSPVFTAGLSTILPGAGQAYSGRWGDAFQSFTVTGLFVGAAAYYFLWSPDTSTANTVKGAVTASLGGLFWIGNIYGAANAALDFDDYQERKQKRQLKNLMESFELEPEINRP